MEGANLYMYIDICMYIYVHVHIHRVNPGFPMTRRASGDADTDAGAGATMRSTSLAMSLLPEAESDTGGEGFGPAALHATLRACYWTLSRSGLRDPQLCATVALRLAAVQCERQAAAEAVSTARHALSEVCLSPSLSLCVCVCVER